jgi:hypothetical protein
MPYCLLANSYLKLIETAAKKWRLAMRLAILIAASLFVNPAIAHADAGNCYILSNCHTPLDSQLEKNVSTRIYEAYGASEISDYDLCFLLRLDKSLKPGKYKLAPMEMNINGLKLWGYELSSSDSTGLKRGATEIANAFKKGSKAFNDLGGPKDK